MSDKFKIAVKAKGGHFEEGTAGAAITPGMAIELQADGNYDPVVTAQAAALKGGLKVALEDALQGKTASNAYASGDVVSYYEPRQGDHLHVLVKSGENIAIADKLIIEGGTSGLFVEAAGTETKFQLEALESSGGALAANTLLLCRVVAP